MKPKLTLPNPETLTIYGATLVQFITSIAGVALGFGLFNSTVEQTVVSATGLIIGAVVQAVSAIERTKAVAK